MPYKSLAQERWAHTPSGEQALGAAGVKEWDQASKGKSLPQRVSHTHEHHIHTHVVVERKAHGRKR